MPELLLAIPELLAAIPEGLAAGAGALGAGAADLGTAAGAAGLATAPAVAGSVLLPTIDVVGAAAPEAAAAGAGAADAAAGASAAGLFGALPSLSDFGGAAGSALSFAPGVAPPSTAFSPLSNPSVLPGGNVTPATSGPGPSGGSLGASGSAAPPSVSPAAASPDLTANAAPLNQPGGVLPPAATPTSGPAVAPTNAVGAPTTVPAAATGGGGFNLSSLSPTNLLSSAGNQLAHNPLALLGAAPLAIDLLKGNQKPPGYSTLEGQANQANAQANQLEGYLSSGQLPPGLQTALDSATNSVEASIRSQYANLGQSGSSAETQAIQSAKENAVSQGAGIAMKLYDTGLSQAQLADSIYAQLMQTALEQDQALSSAVGNFAGSLALMGSRSPVATTSP